jgi:DNA (cytosine-5)-methyltransferase 1
MPPRKTRRTKAYVRSPPRRRHLVLLETPADYSHRLKIAGLFAGIGGLELGLHRAGHETALLCEIEPGARAVLTERFPGLKQHDDIRTLESLPRDVTLVTAGFPCQDLSQAGKTAGIEGSRSGLVGEVFRLLRRRPTEWLILENVPFMLQLSKGRALDVIVTTLESLGYRWAYRVVDSSAFGLPQRRKRVYLVASLQHDPRAVLLSDDAGEPPKSRWTGAEGFGFYWTEGIRGLGAAVNGVPTLKGGSTIGIASPPAILLPNGDVVTPDIRDAERLQGFEPGWTTPAESVTRKGHRWKLVGNAVTVNAAEWLGRRLLQPKTYRASLDLPLKEGARWPMAAWNLGDGRHVSCVSGWPVHRVAKPIHDFLSYPPGLLSAKATRGFLHRTSMGSLRFPKGFLTALEGHLGRMEARLSA